MCHGTGRGNEQQPTPDAKGRKSGGDHRFPELHTGDLTDPTSMNLERKRKVKGSSTLQDRRDLGKGLPADVLSRAINISVVFLLGRV